MPAFGTKRTPLVAPHMSAFGGKADIAWTAQMSANDPKRCLANYFFPGGLYKLATLEALSATALNSAPVQALEVVTSEIVPAAAAANKAAIADSASLVSVISRKSASPVVK
jgi:hypothetical protein